MDCLEIHMLSRDQGCQNRNLSTRIMSLDICFRITLRVSFLLRLFEHLIIISTLKEHLCQHIVCCSIQDSRHFVDSICCQRGIQCTNDWDTPTNTCFKHKIDTSVTSNLKKFCSMFCYQSFVGCSDVLTCFQTTFYKCICRLYASHCLNNNVYFCIIYDCLKIMCQNLFYRIARKISEIQNVFYIYHILSSFIDEFTIGSEDLYNS